MALPDSYTVKYGALPEYFQAIHNAKPPERFSGKFLENLGFASTNDRMVIGVLKDLGFIDSAGTPQQRYFQFLDRSNSGVVLAEAIREAFSDLYAVNTNAHDLSIEEIKNKLRTLYAGRKTDLVIDRIARTFKALAAEADFSRAPAQAAAPPRTTTPEKPSSAEAGTLPPQLADSSASPRLQLRSLQYHINIVLPESRDQAVYDAIFKSMREHLA
jgi:hypothetical protein